METWLNLSSNKIDGAYKEKCVDTNYSNEWYTNVSSEISHDDQAWYYVKPQVVPESQVSELLEIISILIKRPTCNAPEREWENANFN